MLQTKILSCLYRCAVETVIIRCIPVCHGSCTGQDRHALHEHVLKKCNLYQPYQDFRTSRPGSSGGPTSPLRIVHSHSTAQPVHSSAIKEKPQECEISNRKVEKQPLATGRKAPEHYIEHYPFHSSLTVSHHQ